MLEGGGMCYQQVSHMTNYDDEYFYCYTLSMDKMWWSYKQLLLRVIVLGCGGGSYLLIGR